jgi:hypothetical protein
MPSAAPWLNLLLATSLAACSFTAVKRVPSDYQSGAHLDCSDSLTYPLIDTAGTILAGVLAVSLLSVDDSKDLKAASYSSAAVGVGLTASAIYGVYQVNRCRRAQAKEGVVLPNGQGPVEDREPPGTHGGACKEDGSCEDDLICDEPMQVCVPLNPDPAPDEGSP